MVFPSAHCAKVPITYGDIHFRLIQLNLLYKIGNNQKLILSNRRSNPQNPKRKEHTNETSTNDTHGKPNEQLFPEQVVFQLPN